MRMGLILVWKVFFSVWVDCSVLLVFWKVVSVVWFISVVCMKVCCILMVLFIRFLMGLVMLCDWFSM